MDSKILPKPSAVLHDAKTNRLFTIDSELIRQHVKVLMN